MTLKERLAAQADDSALPDEWKERIRAFADKWAMPSDADQCNKALLALVDECVIEAMLSLLHGASGGDRGEALKILDKAIAETGKKNG